MPKAPSAGMAVIADSNNDLAGFQLRVADRCDAAGCHAQAYVATQHGDDLFLVWCAHDFNKRLDSLGGHVIADIRDQLLKKETVNV